MPNVSKMENKIRQDKFFIFTAVSLASAVLLYFNMARWHAVWVGAVLLSIYFIVNGLWLGKIINRFLPLGRICRWLFGAFALFYLLAFGGAIFVAFYKITPLFIFLVFLALTLIISFSSRREIFGDPISENSAETAAEAKNLPRPLLNRKGVVARFSSPDKGGAGGVGPSASEFLAKEDEKKAKIPKFCCVLYAMCCVLCVALLFAARTGQFILSPWEVIPPLYLDAYLLLTFLTALLVFSRRSVKIILFAIVVHSLILHAYLPIVYEPGFGGDKWRHIGAERWLDEGKVYSPALFGVDKDQMEWSQVGPLKIPSVFVVGNKTSYANMWAATIIFSRSLGIDVFWVDFFLGFLLWSVFFPLILFHLAKTLWPRRTFALLAAFLPALFYPFQAYGAITLPVSFGFLPFAFSLIFWLKYLRERESKISFWPLLAVCGLAMYLNYVLYLILTLEVAGLAWLLKKISLKQERKTKDNSRLSGRRFPAIALCLLVVVFILLLPALDVVSGLSFFRAGAFSPGGLLWAGGGFLAEIFTLQPFAPGAGYVSQGNFLFLQVGGSLSEFSLAAVFFWWPAAVSALVWLGVARGIKNPRQAGRPFLFFLMLLVVVLGDHFISGQLMDGVRLLCKRLDVTLAFLIMIFLACGLAKFAVGRSRLASRRAKIIAISLLISLGSALTYASGPKMQTVTADELQAAEYVWNRFKIQDSTVAADQELPNAQPASPAGGRPTSNANYCVLANTWPLLALEAASGREVAAGGFPVYTEYAQPERVKLFAKMSDSPSVVYMEKALAITGAQSCYFMTEKRWANGLDPDYFAKLEQIFGQYVKIGEVYIFKYPDSL